MWGLKLGLFATAWALAAAQADGPIAETLLGKVRGSIIKSWTGRDIMAFKGLRYAKPPLNELRFKPPVPPEPWDGVADGTQDGPVCPQPGAAKYYGPPSEDCLFLNVYTKQLSGSQPVIVFFHPGGWFSVTGRSDWYGPHYLLDHDVVLVTLNYRLGPLGFMSTGDKHSVGNYGLKDQVTALRWVKDNIARFGGNPDSVTIAGYSVGSTSVQLHTMSPMSKGLFHRGIAMSCGSTTNWVITQNPLELTQRLAGLVGCPKTSNEEMVECLRDVPADKLQSTYNSMKDWAYDPMMVFSVVVEPDLGDGGERFMVGRPIDLIRDNQSIAHVPLVLGIAENEFDGRGKWFLMNDTWLHEVNTEFERIAPIAFCYDRETEKSKEFSKKLKQFYLGSSDITKDNKEFGKLYSDSLIIQGQEQSAKLFAHYSTAPVYFYMTTYIGRFSHDVDDVTKKPLGVAHHDELIYLFYPKKRFPDRFNTTDPEATTIKRFTSFWSNFAHSGDPTPDNAGLKWEPMTPEHLQYLDIGDDLSMQQGLPYPERMALWEWFYPTFPKNQSAR